MRSVSGRRGIPSFSRNSKHKPPAGFESAGGSQLPGGLPAQGSHHAMTNPRTGFVTGRSALLIAALENFTTPFPVPICGFDAGGFGERQMIAPIIVLLSA